MPKHGSYILKGMLRCLIMTIIITALFSCNKDCRKDKNMNNLQNKLHLLETVANSQEELPSRILAIKELGASGDLEVSGELKKLLNRIRPEPILMKNWDPIAVERVVDLHIIEALHVLGDDSELGRVPVIIRQAGDILLGPDNELRNAASVILSIGRVELIQQLAMMASENELQSVKNAVIILNQLDLPQAPVGGEVSSVLQSPSKEFTFEIRTLKQELEALTRLSQNQIQLSNGVKEFLVSNDYERGEVRRENVTLVEIVEQDLPMLDFNYYVKNEKVTVCTHKEAGQQWRDWWHKFGKMLTYNKEQSRFELTDY